MMDPLPMKLVDFMIRDTLWMDDKWTSDNPSTHSVNTVIIVIETTLRILNKTTP